MIGRRDIYSIAIHYLHNLLLIMQLDPVLACPVSLRPLSSRVALAGPFVSIEYKECSTYGTKYRVNDVYADLVPQDEKKNAPFWTLSPREMGTQELFRSPFTSFLCK
jgi:hypothetical protein